MSGNLKDDSIAEELESTRWEYRQSDDRKFLFDPIGTVFGSFRWDGQSKPIIPPRQTTPDTGDRGE